MTPRERMYQAVHRGTPDHVPKDIGLTPAVMAKFKSETGMDSPELFFGLECRGVDLVPMEHSPDFSAYLAQMPPGAVINSDYGTAEIPGDFYHFARRTFPMANLDTTSDLDVYPWPDYFSDYRYAGMPAKVAQLHDQGWFVSSFAGHIFEVAWQLTGFEKFMEGLTLNPEFLAGIVDRITENNVMRARKAAQAGVDMVAVGDDVAMQDRMMMAPATWRDWLKPRLAKVIKAATEVNPGLAIWYHSDGAVFPIIEDLIEVGVTVLNPVQPECMDVYQVKREFGDRLAFWGTIGTQTVLPFGTPDDVRKTVREMIDLFAPGLVLAPTHVVEPDVPWKNLIAFKEAVEDYGALS